MLNAIETVDRFTASISQPEYLTWDYGDWMRHVNMELNELKLLLADEPQTVQTRLSRIQDFVQLEPDWNIMNTLRRTIREAIALREVLGATDNKTLADYGVSATENDPSFVTH